MVALSQIAAIISEASNLIASGFWLILQLSSCIGRHLVNQVVFILDFANGLVQLTVEFLRVLCEDSLLFFQDLGDKSVWIVSFVAKGICHFADGVAHLSSGALSAAAKAVNFTHELISSLWGLTSFVKTCVSVTGEGFLLIGSSVWLAVTRTPTGILNCVIWIIIQLQNFLNGIGLFCIGIKNEMISTAAEFFTWIFNVPHGSVLGLVIALLLFYSSVRNYRTIISIIFKISRMSYCFLSSVCYNLWNGHLFESRREGELNSPGIEDKLCIVCQDRLKEIITLPCRHMCLCIQCSLHIARNHKLCPICRTRIQTTMKVYI